MATLGATLSTTALNTAPTIQYVVPTAAATVTAGAGSNVLVLLNPAGTLATMTFALNASPVDGDQVTVSTTQIISALTVSGGTIIGSLSSLALAGFAKFIWNATASVWFRIG